MALSLVGKLGISPITAYSHNVCPTLPSLTISHLGDPSSAAAMLPCQPIHP